MSKKNTSYTGIRVIVSILLVLVALAAIGIAALGYLEPRGYLDSVGFLKFDLNLEDWLIYTFAGAGVVVLILWFWFLGVTGSLAKSSKKLQA